MSANGFAAVLASTSKAWFEVGTVYEPSQTAHVAYQLPYERYLLTYPALKDGTHKMVVRV